MSASERVAGRVGSRTAERILRLAPLALVILAEAAWIAVVGGLLQEFALRPSVLGVPAIAAFVASGVVIGRVVGPGLGARWPFAAVAIVFGAAVVGWALSGDAREATRLGPLAALAAHPGGLVAGLAVLRGFAHVRLPLEEGTVERLLGVGIPGLAVASVLGGLIAEPLRSRFLADALASAITFVASAALALAFARLDAVGQDGGFDWRRNPRWLVLTVAVLAAAIVAALPMAAVAGAVLSVLISAALGPMLIIGLANGFDAGSRRLLVGMGLVAAILVALSRILGKQTSPTGVTGGLAGGNDRAPVEPIVGASVGGLLVVGAVVGVVLLVALWMRRTARIDDAVDEARTIDRSGDPSAQRRRRRRFGRVATPRTASDAYVALLDDLERRPAVRRDAAETPAGHAARLRPTGAAGLALDLLAADFALERYGGVALSRRENARGVARWRVLRQRLAHVAREPGALVADPSVPLAGTDVREGSRTGIRAG